MKGFLSNATNAVGGVADKALGAATKIVPAPDDQPAQDAAGGGGTATKVTAAGQAAMGLASAAASTAGQAAMGVAGSAAVSAGQAAAGAVGTAACLASDVAMEQKQKAANMIKELRAMLEAFVKQKLQAQIECVVDKVPGVAKNSLEDEEMPRCVSRGKDRAVDSMWPDVRTEIMWEVAVFLDGQDRMEAVPDTPGSDCCRAFFRYHQFPFDKSIWGKLRDPFFILFQLIPLVPVYGVTQLWFFFVFCMIDKSDEFQLIQFILSFKGMQFITFGIIRALTGFTLFMMCVTAEADDEDHSCEVSGPGSGGDIWMTAFGIVFQVLLVWLAFNLLRCSTPKGKSVLKGVVSHEEQGMAGTPGGYIIYFLWYDLVGFFLSLSIVAYAVTTRPDYDFRDWPVEHSVFAAQVVYGFLSFPFFLFTLPVLQRMLTHSFPTAYDREGRCRKSVKPPKKNDVTPKKEELITEAEVNELYSRMKKLLPMP